MHVSVEDLLMWQIIKSTFAAFLGVQSDKNRQRDLEDPNFVGFFIVGVIMTVLLVVTIVGLLIWLTP